MDNSHITAEMCLATYGTLAPGRVNNHQLAQLQGTWHHGSVKGRLIESGWGAELGYPGLILDPSAPTIDVFIFQSLDLPDHWPRLDEFEGAGYKRVVTQVALKDGFLDASIYVIDASG